MTALSGGTEFFSDELFRRPLENVRLFYMRYEKIDGKSRYFIAKLFGKTPENATIRLRKFS